MLRKSSFIAIGVGLVACALMWAYLKHIRSDIRHIFIEEYELSSGAGDLALECFGTGKDVFGFSEEVLIWDFCGCLASDISGLLDDEELEFTAYLFRRHDRTGQKVPTASTARSAVEGRVADALQRSTLACRGLLNPRP